MAQAVGGHSFLLKLQCTPVILAMSSKMITAEVSRGCPVVQVGRSIFQPPSKGPHCLGC